MLLADNWATQGLPMLLAVLCLDLDLDPFGWTMLFVKGTNPLFNNVLIDRLLTQIAVMVKMLASCAFVSML